MHYNVRGVHMYASVTELSQFCCTAVRLVQIRSAARSNYILTLEYVDGMSLQGHESG
jgi:hypothetical protein